MTSVGERREISTAPAIGRRSADPTGDRRCYHAEDGTDRLDRRIDGAGVAARHSELEKFETNGTGAHAQEDQQPPARIGECENEGQRRETESPFRLKG